MFDIHNVIKPDGSMRLEQDCGNMRFDLTNGTVTQKLSSTGQTNTVLRPDGTIGIEQNVGGLRFNLDKSNFDQKL